MKMGMGNKLLRRRNDGGGVGLGLGIYFHNGKAQYSFGVNRSNALNLCQRRPQKRQGAAGKWAVRRQDNSGLYLIRSVSVLELADHRRNYQVLPEVKYSQTVHRRNLNLRIVVESFNQKGDKRFCIGARIADASHRSGSNGWIGIGQRADQMGNSAGTEPGENLRGRIFRVASVGPFQYLDQPRYGNGGLFPHTKECIPGSPCQSRTMSCPKNKICPESFIQPGRGSVDAPFKLRLGCFIRHPFQKKGNPIGTNLVNGVFCIFYGDPESISSQTKNPFAQPLSSIARLLVSGKVKCAGDDDPQDRGKKEELFAARRHQGENGIHVGSTQLRTPLQAFGHLLLIGCGEGKREGHRSANVPTSTKRKMGGKWI